MPGKSLKCPSCAFRSRTMKGIKIHWNAKHSLRFPKLPTLPRSLPDLPTLPRSLPNLPTFPRSFLNSLSSEQIRLFQFETTGGEQAPVRRSNGFPAGSVQTSASSESSNFGSSCRQCSACPTGTGRSEDPVPDNALMTQDFVILPKFRENGDALPAAAQPFCCKSGEPSGLGCEHQKLEQIAFSPPSDSRRGCGRAVNASTRPETAQRRSTKRNADQSYLDLASPHVTRSSRNECRPSSVTDDPEVGDVYPSFPCSSNQGPKSEARVGGRRPLKDLWPACVLEMIYTQPCDEESPFERENFLSLLGDCPVLDYNSSSAWDLVLRCSLCEKPLSGMRNMEAHIRSHLQKGESLHEVQGKFAGDFTCQQGSRRTITPECCVQDSQLLGSDTGLNLSAEPRSSCSSA